MPETNLLGFTPTSGIVDDIRKKNKPFITSQSYTPSDNLFGGGGSSSRSGKTLTMMDTLNAQPLENSIGGETGVSAEDALVKLSDGTYINKYKDYFVGTDNDERLAQQQTTGEKWANGVEKALLKTGNAVLGGTAGIIYGIGALATEGSLSALYDNDFSNTLADWDTKLGYQLPNYYTKQEQEKGLGGQMGTANFWADKVLGGLSFTAGAIISEGLWAAATGGTSLAVGAARLGARFGRLGRGAADIAKIDRWTVEGLGEAAVLEGLAKNKGYLKQAIGTAFKADRINIQQAINLGKAVDLFNTARFAVTSAGFESSVEALQYKKEATANFYSTFFDKNGREPDANDIATFNNNLENSANAVFGVNMAIVGSSNLVTMGKLFELKNPIKTGFTEFIEAKAFGYGINKAGKVLEATRAQKIGRNIFAYSKAPITEGLYEEGLQGVTTKTANKWIDHTYSDKNTAETFSTMGAVYESLAEQYGTKEGWVENGVGMIIGALGGSVNTRSEQKAKQAQLEFKAQGIETFSPEKGLLVQALMPKKVMMANQIAGFSAEAKAEAEQGNVVKSEIAGEGVIHAFLNHKYALGESFDDATNEIKTALDTITEEQFKNAEIANPTAWKEQKLNEFSAEAKAFKKNRKFSEYIIGKNPTKGEQGIASILGDTFQGMNRNEALIQSMTWILTEGETAGKFMNDIQARIESEVGAEHRATMQTISSLNKATGYTEAQVIDLTNKYEGLTKTRDEVQREIAELNAAPRETEGDKVRGKALEAANLRLLDLNDNIAELNVKITNIADQLNKQNSYQEGIGGLDFKQDISGTTITAQTLLDLNDNVDKFKNLVESLKASNPQRGAYISDLLDEYSQAEDIFLANQRTMDMLTSGKMKLEKINTWLGKKMFKNKSMDEASRDWLTDALNRFEKNVLSTVGAVTQEAPKTKEELAARKEELTNLPEEDRTEETDKELKDINEQLKEPTNKNREVTPKSDIQKQIEALEAERAQKLAEVKPIEVKEKQVTTAEELEQQKDKELSEVKPIIVKERVETPSTFETVKDTKEEERLSAKKQKIEDSMSKLEDGTTSEDRTKVVVYYNDVAKGVEFNLIDGVWKTMPASTKKGQKVKPIEAGAKDLQKIEEKLKENPNQQKIEKLKEQLAEVEQQLENIPLVEREVKQEPTFIETEVENTAEINRINAKYEKLMNNTPTSKPQSEKAVWSAVEEDVIEYIKKNKELTLTAKQWADIVRSNYKGVPHYDSDSEQVKDLKNKIEKEGYKTFEDDNRVSGKINEKGEFSLTDGNHRMIALELIDPNQKVTIPIDFVNGEIVLETSGYKLKIPTTNIVKFLEKSLPTQQNAPQEDNTQQQQKDKINREYDQRIQKLKTPPVDNSKAVEDYKNRIEKMLAKGYYSLESIGKNYEDLKDLEPTQEEIEEFRKGKAELGEKLSNWKLLDSATDAEGNSIADLVKLIKQLETPQKETDTKTDLTEEDIDFLQEGSEASGDIVVNELLQNFLAHAKVKKLKTGKYRFTHLKLSQIINRLITEDVKPTVKGEVVTLAEIDKLKPGAVVTILNTEFTLGESGRIEIDVKKFGSIKQALGFELLDSGGNWSYHDIYEYKGGTWTKVETQYEDGTFEQSTSYELQKDDVVSFEIGNENGHNLTLYNAWINAQKALDESKATNKTKLEDAVKEALKEFKNGIVIYAVDSKGRRIAPLKALKSGIAEETFLRIRQRAFDNFDIALDKIDLKVTSKVVNVYLGTPQLLIFDGKAENTEFTKQTITQVEATGYIKDEEIVTSQEYPKGVDTTFLKKMVKQNKGVGIAFVVITKGLHKLAYPVNLRKEGESKLTELKNATANKTANEQVLIINDLIQKYSLEVEPLLFGELEDEVRIEEVYSAFENYETHISLEKFADKKYNKEDLIKDATINIDLTDMDNAISDPKVRISLDEDVVKFEESKEVLEAREISTVAKASKIADELYDKLHVYLGTAVQQQNRFIDIILDGFTPESERGNNFPRTIFPNRAAATQGNVGGDYSADAYTASQRGFNVLKAAFDSLTRLTSEGKEVSNLTTEGKEIIDKKLISKIANIFKMHEKTIQGLKDLKKNKNSAEKNARCPK